VDELHAGHHSWSELIDRGKQHLINKFRYASRYLDTHWLKLRSRNSAVMAVIEPWRPQIF
jgi:hypothetical protein